MLNASFHKLLLLILRLVKTDDKGNPKLLEDRYIVIGCEASIFVRHILRSRKCNEATRDYPVQVSILDFFVVLILLHIERGVVVPI